MKECDNSKIHISSNFIRGGYKNTKWLSRDTPWLGFPVLRGIFVSRVCYRGRVLQQWRRFYNNVFACSDIAHDGYKSSHHRGSCFGCVRTRETKHCHSSWHNRCQLLTSFFIKQLRLRLIYIKWRPSVKAMKKWYGWLLQRNVDFVCPTYNHF